MNQCVECGGVIEEGSEVFIKVRIGNEPVGVHPCHEECVPAPWPRRDGWVNKKNLVKK